MAKLPYSTRAISQFHFTSAFMLIAINIFVWFVLLKILPLFCSKRKQHLFVRQRLSLFWLSQTCVMRQDVVRRVVVRRGSIPTLVVEKKNESPITRRSYIFQKKNDEKFSVGNTVCCLQSRTNKTPADFPPCLIIIKIKDDDFVSSAIFVMYTSTKTSGG